MRVRQQVRTAAPCSGCTSSVTEPITEYLAFELASYVPDVDASEDVRIIGVATRRGGERSRETVAARSEPGRGIAVYQPGCRQRSVAFGCPVPA